MNSRHCQSRRQPVLGRQEANLRTYTAQLERPFEHDVLLAEHLRELQRIERKLTVSASDRAQAAAA